jgi:hypothetical protein
MTNIKVNKISPGLSRVLIETTWSGLPFFTPEYNIQEFNKSVIYLSKLVDYLYTIFGESSREKRKNPLSALSKQKGKSGRKRFDEDVWAYKQIFDKGCLPPLVKKEWLTKVHANLERQIDEESINRTWLKISQSDWMNANELD